MDCNNSPDHPIIRNVHGTGYPDGLDRNDVGICPKCGEQCDFFYVDENREVVGCENCISMYEAESWLNDEEDGYENWEERDCKDSCEE